MLRVGHAIYSLSPVRTLLSQEAVKKEYYRFAKVQFAKERWFKTTSVPFSSVADEYNNDVVEDEKDDNNKGSSLRQVIATQKLSNTNKKNNRSKAGYRNNNNNRRHWKNKDISNEKKNHDSVSSFEERMHQIRNKNDQNNHSSPKGNPSKRNRRKNFPRSSQQLDNRKNKNGNSTDKSNSIESLRAVFLKSVELDRERRDEEIKRQQSPSREAKSSHDSLLFKTMTKDRKRREGMKASQMMKKNNSNVMERTTYRDEPFSLPSWRTGNKGHETNNQESVDHIKSPYEKYLEIREKRLNFYDSKYDEDRKKKEGLKKSNTKRGKRRSKYERQRELILSNDMTEINVRTFANMLREKIDTITKTLINLGELDPSFLSSESTNNNPKKKIRQQKSKRSSPVSIGDRVIDAEIAELVAMELGFDVTRSDDGTSTRVEIENASLIGRRKTDNNEYDENDDEISSSNEIEYVPRAPVVSIMGHVDHGKTTLMDALRRMSTLDPSNINKKKSKGKKQKNKKASIQTNGGDVAGTEAGGITQVVSAFQVPLQGLTNELVSSDYNSVTFLDTPGHAAFKSMRQSGSNATDVVVLVIAADDGVSPQTIEIIEMYKRIEEESGGNISLLVAMTKIDKEGVNVNKSKQKIEGQLMEYGIYPNDVQIVPVSGITGDGLDELVETLVLQAQVMDLKADLEARGEGVVIDARMEKGLGIVADCVIRWGNIEKGDVFVSGTNMGKVRILTDVNGKQLKKGIASQPVRIVGLKSLPKAGDPLICVESEEAAKEIIEMREAVNNEVNVHRAEQSMDSQDDLQITGSAAKVYSNKKRILDRYGLTDENNDENKESKSIYIPVIIKADADGSLHAVKESLLSIGTMCKEYDITIDPVEASVGSITANDLFLAKESQAIIFGFGIKGGYDKKAAEEAGVVIKQYDVIYSLLDDAKDEFSSYLPLIEADKIHGRGVVQAVFTLNNKMGDKIAGLKVRDGNLLKDKCPESGLGCRYRIIRNGNLVCSEEGILADSLRKVKEDVQKVKKGEECGLGLQAFSDIKEGDIVECFSIEMKKQSI